MVRNVRGGQLPQHAGQHSEGAAAPRERCPRTACFSSDSIRSPGAPRPAYRHLAIHIATRHFKLIRGKILEKALLLSPKEQASLLHRHLCATICLCMHVPHMVLVMPSPCRTCSCMFASPLRMPLPACHCPVAEARALHRRV